EHFRNLPVAEALKEAKRKDFRRPRPQPSYGSSQGSPEAEITVLRGRGSRQAQAVFQKRNRLLRLSRSNHIERGINCRPAQIGFGILNGIGVLRTSAEEWQKNGFKNIF